MARLLLCVGITEAGRPNYQKYLAFLCHILYNKYGRRWQFFGAFHGADGSVLSVKPYWKRVLTALSIPAATTYGPTISPGLYRWRICTKI